ncbi:calcium-binding protein, partial [Rhizobium sp. FKY42]|uniref:calcium-binding protein n=1 Tax=Rhizobium sp. FKY42 TaxID=2562310 RepID=UPI00197DB064
MSENNNNSGFAGLSKAIDAFSAALAGVIIAKPHLTAAYPALQFLPAMVVDGFGTLSAQATPSDPTKGMPQKVAEAVAGFLGSTSGTALAVHFTPIVLASIGVSLPPLWAGIIAAVAVYVISQISSEVSIGLVEFAFWLPDSPLLAIFRDPLILDLDGDGIELSSLADSNVHFDYDRDGFAEKTGWVQADDGILVIDANNNGVVDGAGELFGSPSKDGFAVLETLDDNRDGKIDFDDAAFAQLRIWQDLDQNGGSDQEELRTLSDADIAAIALERVKIAGTNNGHNLGYEATFLKADGTSGAAQTIYFQTDRQDTRADNTPVFTIGAGVSLLPQLPGSGQINSIAWKATVDASFRDGWTALADDAATLTLDVLKGRFENLLIKWAGVENVEEGARGSYVNAQHLAFIEKFFGTSYQEIYANQGVATSPARPEFGMAIEASFENVTNVLLTVFLSQVSSSAIMRGGAFDVIVDSPYFSYSILNFTDPNESGYNNHGNIAEAVELIVGLMPQEPGPAVDYLSRALGGLEGMVTTAFGGDRAQYQAAISPYLSDISDSILQQVATSIVRGDAVMGTSVDDGLIKLEGNDVFDAGHGDDVIISGTGSDVFIYRNGDGSDIIRDKSTSVSEVDVLILTDLTIEHVTFERIGDTLQIKISESNSTILSENFFYNWGRENRGIDKIRFSDGQELSRQDIAIRSTTVGDDRNNLVRDTADDDTLRADRGDDQILISAGNDTVVYAVGDGNDIISDSSGIITESDTLKLLGIMPGDVELSRVGNDLLIQINASDEQVVSVNFFVKDVQSGSLGGWGIDNIKFQNGIVWDKATIAKQAFIRGDNRTNTLSGDTTDDQLTGSKANDSLAGGRGSDSYFWRTGDGNDTIVESNNDANKIDRLILEDVLSGDIELLRRGTSLLIHIKPSGETIDISYQFEGITNIEQEWNATKYGIEQIVFSNGTTWDRLKIMSSIVNIGLDLDIQGVNFGSVPADYRFTDEFNRVGDFYDLKSGVFVHNNIFGIHDIAYGSDLDDTEFFNSSVGFDNPGNDGHNYYDGRGGNDILVGGNGHDVLIGGTGSDQLYGDARSGNSGSGNDWLNGGDGDDDLFGGAGNDTLIGGAGNDNLSGGDGTDILQDSGNGNDVFNGGRGDDMLLSSGSGNDTFIYASGDGNDLIVDESSSESDVDVLKFTDLGAEDLLFSQVNNDLDIKVLNTGQSITVSGFFTGKIKSTASVGIDQIQFSDGSFWNRSQIEIAAKVRGTDGRDVLQNSSALDSTFIGNPGDDIILSAPVRGSANGGGANGSDTFIYSSGDGNDIIFDGSHAKADVETDTLILTDLNPEDVQLSRSDIDLLIRDLRTGQTIENEGFFWAWETTGQGIDVIQFADGTTWNRVQMRDMAWVWGSAAKDVLVADYTYDNVFVGGTGDDILQSSSVRGSANGGGSNGNDRFLYAIGDGNDLIFDGSHSLLEKDRLIFSGINPDDIRLLVDGIDIIIKILPTDHKIVDEGAMWNRQFVGQGLDEIEFANGAVWDREDIHYWATEGSIFYQGTSVNDRVIGSYLDQRLGGGGGADYIDGGAGSDLIFGDSGNDTLAVSISNLGDLDQLNGGDGIDTATFVDQPTGIYADLVQNNGEVRTWNSSISSNSEGRLIATLTEVENIIGTTQDDKLFGDDAANILSGKAGNDTLDGRSGNDTLVGGQGNDTLLGYNGDDTYIFDFGDGDDLIDERPDQGNDTLKLTGILPELVTFSLIENDLLISIDGGGSLRLRGTGAGLHFDQYGIEAILFDNGTKWDATYLRQLSIFASSTDGDDVLIGTSASGSFGGGKGDDTLNGAGGNDTYIYARGDGNDTIAETTNWNGTNDRIVFTNINPSDVTLVREGNDLRILIAESAVGAGDGGSILAKESVNENSNRGIESVAFSDGTVWTRADIGMKIADTTTTIVINGTVDDDTLNGTGQNEAFLGGLGNDLLNSGAGSDTFIYSYGDGSDRIVENSGSNAEIDVLRFT